MSADVSRTQRENNGNQLRRRIKIYTKQAKDSGLDDKAAESWANEAAKFEVDNEFRKRVAAYIKLAKGAGVNGEAALKFAKDAAEIELQHDKDKLEHNYKVQEVQLKADTRKQQHEQAMRSNSQWYKGVATGVAGGVTVVTGVAGGVALAMGCTVGGAAMLGVAVVAGLVACICWLFS